MLGSHFNTSRAQILRDEKLASTEAQYCLIIIVDQMIHDYVQFMPKLKGFISVSSNFTKTYLRHVPAQTPVGHATISTGLRPAEDQNTGHGIIGWEWYKGINRIELNSELKHKGDITNILKAQTLADMAWKKDFRVVTISGKRPVSLILGCTSFDKEEKRYFALFPEHRTDNMWIMLETEDIDPKLVDTDRGTKLFRNSIVTPRPIENKYNNPEPLDELVFKAAVEVLENYLCTERKDRRWLLLVSFSATDLAGHRFGPYSHRVKNCLKQVDYYIFKLREMLSLKGLLDDTVFVLTSDHGARVTFANCRIQPLSASTRIRYVKTSFRRIRRGSRAIYVEKKIKDIEHDTEVGFHFRNLLVAGNDIGYVYLQPQDHLDIICPQLSMIPYIRCILGKRGERGLVPNRFCTTYVDALIKCSKTRDNVGDLILIPDEGVTIQSPYESYDPPPGSHGSCHLHEKTYHIPLLISGQGVPCIGNRQEDADGKDVFQDKIAPTVAHLLDLDFPNDTRTKQIKL